MCELELCHLSLSQPCIFSHDLHQKMMLAVSRTVAPRIRNTTMINVQSKRGITNDAYYHCPRHTKVNSFLVGAVGGGILFTGMGRYYRNHHSQ